IDGIFASIDLIKGRRRENLEKAREQLALARMLVTLKSDAAIAFSLDAARIRPLDTAKLLPLFQQFGFNRFQDEVRRLASAALQEAPSLPDLFAELGRGESAAAATGTAASGHYEAVTTPAQLAQLVATLQIGRASCRERV